MINIPSKKKQAKKATAAPKKKYTGCILFRAGDALKDEIEHARKSAGISQDKFLKIAADRLIVHIRKYGTANEVPQREAKEFSISLD